MSCGPWAHGDMLREAEAHAGSPCRFWERSKLAGASPAAALLRSGHHSHPRTGTLFSTAWPLCPGQPSCLRTRSGLPRRGAPGQGISGRQQRFAASPGPNSLAASRSSSTMGQVGRQLAIIGDDINRRYDSEFQAMLQHLQPTAENAYEYFTKIASR